MHQIGCVFIPRKKPAYKINLQQGNPDSFVILGNRILNELPVQRNYLEYRLVEINIFKLLNIVTGKLTGNLYQVNLVGTFSFFGFRLRINLRPKAYFFLD